MVLRVLIFALLLGASPALGQGFSGTLHVVDGDTFDVGDVRVRLFGVDAVERSQTCIDRAGTRWASSAAGVRGTPQPAAAAASARLDS